MSVALILVTLMLFAMIYLVHLPALVIVDSLEMDSFAKVS